jgi:hypothetical protein
MKWRLPLTSHSRAWQNQIGVMQFYGLTHFFLKMSIMLQYSRVATLPREKRLCFAIIVAFLRLQTLVPSANSADPTWDKVPSGVYGVTEANLGITCACIVTLRPLLHKFHQLWSSLPNIRGARAGFSTESNTNRSMPVMSRIRASLYHSTVSSRKNTQVSSSGIVDRDVGDVSSSAEKAERVVVVEEQRRVSAGTSTVRVRATTGTCQETKPSERFMGDGKLQG